MDAILSISCDILSDEKIQYLTNDIMNAVNRETNVTAKLAEHNEEDGTKGELISLGTIILAGLSSSTIVALFELLKAFSERNRSLKISMKRPDGGEINVEGVDVIENQEHIVELAQRFFSIKSQ